MNASTSAPVAHNALPPPPTSSVNRSSRIAPHSHIKGLGLSTEGLAAVDGAGFIGQTNAREVMLYFCFNEKVEMNEPIIRLAASL